MSEKRKGHFDPRHTETYQSLQRVKGSKDVNKGEGYFIKNNYSIYFITIFAQKLHKIEFLCYINVIEFIEIA